MKNVTYANFASFAVQRCSSGVDRSAVGEVERSGGPGAAHGGDGPGEHGAHEGDYPLR